MMAVGPRVLCRAIACVARVEIVLSLALILVGVVSLLI
jgi:hypothetical protein